MSAARLILQGERAAAGGDMVAWGRVRADILCEAMRQAGHEIEIKLRVDDLAAMRRRLRGLGARGGARVHEVNVLFDTAEESLRARGMLLRVRVERTGGRRAAGKRGGGRRAFLDARLFPPRGRQSAVITLKAPPLNPAASAKIGAKAPRASEGAYKVRREIEFAVPDSSAFREVLAALGFGAKFYYEKIRTHYELPNVRGVEITLDETPVGAFFELEGTPAGIDRARHRLGYGPEDAILLSYGALYANHCRERGVTARDMLFEPGK